MAVLAFYKGTRQENPTSPLFDRLVCWWPRSRGRFAHAEVVADDRSPLAGPVVCRSSSMRDGGVRAKSINLTTGRWVLVSLPAYDHRAAEATFERHKGSPYDYPGILGYLVPLIKQIRSWFYCSEWSAVELVAMAAVAGLPAPPSTNISPSALFAWASQQPGAEVSDFVVSQSS